MAKIFGRGFPLCGEQEKAFIIVVVVAAADSQTIITLTGCNDIVLCHIVRVITTALLHVLLFFAPPFSFSSNSLNLFLFFS